MATSVPRLSAVGLALIAVVPAAHGHAGHPVAAGVSQAAHLHLGHGVTFAPEWLLAAALAAGLVQFVRCRSRRRQGRDGVVRATHPRGWRR